MKPFWIASVLLVVSGFASHLAAATICPSTAFTNSDCAFIITIGPGGSITGDIVPGAGPYDGEDDSLIGVINNSGSIFNGSIHLSGTGNGGGLFNFDDDGICTLQSTNSISLDYCSPAQQAGNAPGDYQGPLNTFTDIDATFTRGTVVITGLEAGGTTFFSLESSPASINGGGGPLITVDANVPEPTSISLVAVGLLGILLARGRTQRRFPDHS
jgi:hypothetical protein